MIASLPALRFFPESASGPADVCDFLIGNPHEMPLEAYAEALRRWTPPRHELWYAYKRNEPEARAVVAASLRAWRGMPFEADDIFMTNGAIAALHVLFSTLVDPGDEVICVTPAWFEYEGMIIHAGGVPVQVCADTRTYDLDAGDHAAHARGSGELAEQSQWQDLPAGNTDCVGLGVARGEHAQRAYPLPDLRRGLQPHRLRRTQLRQPDPVLSQLFPGLYLRQGAAHPRGTDRLHRHAADHARPPGLS
jgi:hypothetical protein